MSSINSEIEIIKTAKENLANTLVDTFGVQAQDEVDAGNNVTSEGLSDSNGNLKRLSEWAPLLENSASKFATKEEMADHEEIAAAAFASLNNRIDDSVKLINLWDYCHGELIPRNSIFEMPNGLLFDESFDESFIPSSHYGTVLLKNEKWYRIDCFNHGVSDEDSFGFLYTICEITKEGYIFKLYIIDFFGVSMILPISIVEGKQETVENFEGYSGKELWEVVSKVIEPSLDLQKQINAINKQIDTINKRKLFEIVRSLPTDNIEQNLLYLVPSTKTEEGNLFTEYLYIYGDWEKLGEYKADIDLSEYAKKSDIKEYNPTVTNPTDWKAYHLLFCDVDATRASHFTNNRLRLDESPSSNILTVGNEDKYGSLRLWNGSNQYTSYTTQSIAFPNNYFSLLGSDSTIANEQKWTTLALGNSSSYTSTNPHQGGVLRLYGQTTGGHSIYPEDTENIYNHYLPNTTGETSYLVSSTFGTAVGSSTQPVYINANGEAVACTNIIPSYWANIPAQTSSSTETTPQFKTVNIGGGCTLQYDDTNKCVKFIF